MGALKGKCLNKPGKGQMWTKDRYVTLLPKGVKLGKAIKMTTESSIASLLREADGDAQVTAIDKAGVHPAYKGRIGDNLPLKIDLDSEQLLEFLLTEPE